MSAIFSGNTILGIDKDPDITLILKILLENSGYNTRMANTGPAGFTLVRQKSPHFNIVDSMLAGLNGLGFCKLIKSENLADYLIVMVGFGTDLITDNDFNDNAL